MKRWREYFPNWPGQIVSLDSWIEKKQGLTIADIFKNQGETSFRKMEEEALIEISNLYQNQDLVVDVGGGFQGRAPEDFQALWLQRRVDLSQAQFLDRPNLDGQLKISAQRFQERQLRFAEMATYVFELDEGDLANSGEKVFIQELISESIKGISLSNSMSSFSVFDYQGFKLQTRSLPWTTTLLNDHQAQSVSIQPWGSSRPYEWRDDLISHQAMREGLANTPLALISMRSRGRSKQTLQLVESGNFLWDWPLEWGRNSEAPLLSLHAREDNLLQTLRQLPQTDQKIKLAISIHSFAELELGYRWYLENPEERSFLPSSCDGRWQWFRLLTGFQMPVSFLRNGQSSHLDQPTLLQVLNFQHSFKKFAAILGSPVRHSLTPSFHRDYFKIKKANTLAVDLKEDEFDQALFFLKKMGLCYAAVTSPLKEKAGQYFNTRAFNTLYLSEDGDRVMSTDEFGFQALLKTVTPTKNIVVWGGGGVIQSIEPFLPGAAYFSSRTGLQKSGPEINNPQHLVWAVGTDAFSKEGVFPPEHWRPHWVTDLNYTLDSPAIAYANKLGCQYQSGLVMFKAQALKQQEFWDECERK